MSFLRNSAGFFYFFKVGGAAPSLALSRDHALDTLFVVQMNLPKLI